MNICVRPSSIIAVWTDAADEDEARTTWSVVVYMVGGHKSTLTYRDRKVAWTEYLKISEAMP